MPQPEIKRLTPALLPDFLTFFDRDAFADNPSWAGCYCVFYHASDEEWEFDSGQGEIADAAGRARKHRPLSRTLVKQGGMSGFLAYVDGRVAGWCNAAPRESYQNPRVYGKARDGTGAVGAIMCFVVAQAHRRSGVATALLDAVCDSFQADGLDYVEAYPSLKPGGPNAEAGMYHGPMELYLRAGFERVRDIGGFAVMRKRLA